MEIGGTVSRFASSLDSHFVKIEEERWQCCQFSLDQQEKGIACPYVGGKLMRRYLKIYFTTVPSSFHQISINFQARALITERV